MRKLFIISALLLLTKISLCQTPSLVGTWHFIDSATTTSYYFQKDGGCFIHKGLKDGVILAGNLRKGTYELKDGLLTIKWADNTLEKRKLEFIDKDSFRFSNPDKAGSAKNDSPIFKRLIYEGVVEAQKIGS